MIAIAATIAAVRRVPLVAWVLAALAVWTLSAYTRGLNDGARKVERRAVQQTERISNEIARRTAPAAQPGSAGRLLRNSCRDC